MKGALAEEILDEMENYLKSARCAYIQMLKDVLPSSDYVIDGTNTIETIADESIKIMITC